MHLHQQQHSRRGIITKMTTPLSPKEIVAELDRFIVGQKAAKRAVAIVGTRDASLNGRNMAKKLGEAESCISDHRDGIREG